jgi:hypothetical protein
MEKMSAELEEYLCNRYGLVKVPVSIKNRLQDAYNSSLFVKPEYLLAEWKTMESYLNNIRAQNVAKGNELTGYRLLGYDLSIVLEKYERFVRYIVATEKQNQEVEHAFELHEMVQNVLKHNRPEVEELKDVSDLVDEIYDSIGV